jgi:hypothetical protein
MSDQERAAAIIRRAVEIMKEGCRGWSWALSEAKKQVK